jgi:hypothetical protein
MKRLGYLLFVLLILRLSLAASKGHLSQICPRCKGKRINSRLKTPGFGNFVLAEIPGKPEGKKVVIYAWLCLSCGYVELHTCLPENIKVSNKPEEEEAK